MQTKLNNSLYLLNLLSREVEEILSIFSLAYICGVIDERKGFVCLFVCLANTDVECLDENCKPKC